MEFSKTGTWTVVLFTILFTITLTTASLPCQGTCKDILKPDSPFLESRQTSLENKNYALEHEIIDLKIRTNEMEIQVNLLKNKILASDSKCGSLVNRTELLEALVNDLEVNITMINAALCSLNQGPAFQPVSFHARMSEPSRNYTGKPNSTIVMDDVITNEGDAYNGTTGVFTAPVNGTYFFLASTADYWQNWVSVLALMVDDREIDFSATSRPLLFQSAFVHGVVTLHAGQRVWLTNKDGGEYYLGKSSAFSGSLLYSFSA